MPRKNNLPQELKKEKADHGFILDLDLFFNLLRSISMEKLKCS